MPSAGGSSARQRKRKTINSHDETASDRKEFRRKKKKAANSNVSICLRVLTGVACFLVGTILAVVLVAFFTKSPIDPEEFALLEPPTWTDALTPNSMLQQAKRLLQGEILGPESVLYHEGMLYTGTWDGRVLEIDGEKIRNEWKFGSSPCTGAYDEEPTCGRPLGIRATSQGKLIVADAYLGLFEISLGKEKPVKLVSSGTRVAGTPLNFLNDLDIMKNGTIIFTDSSKWDRRRFPYALLENRGDGRLLSYNPTTKKISVLEANLHFANGVQLAPDESYVLVSETARARIMKYHLVGDLRGKTTVFKDNLPFLPDNIRLAFNGSFWVAGVSPRKKDTFSMFDTLAAYPRLRSLIIQVVPAKYLALLMTTVAKPYGLGVLLDHSGRIVSTLHDPTGKVIPDISQITDTGKKLYFGSFHSPFLSVLEYS